MVTLSLQTTQQLQEIIREDYGAEISLEKTAELASGLISYFDLLASIHHRSSNEVRGVPLSQGADRGLYSKFPNANTGETR